MFDFHFIAFNHGHQQYSFPIEMTLTVDRYDDAKSFVHN